ncbi:hypothetical protein Q4Q35_07075 [Flavivirga aquimarina]|uniref:Lipoprotein n=1 Tax=Flavivirga aquimarina TaxID=2027862 RepID=A0ABT8W905_9FLAO|nr:hypothetical protein [Flavivirga aquimarina]MDO5969563.1 hypothetical protein [Flavivirga aquimarina]
MKKIINIIFGLIILTSCNQNQESKATKSKDIESAIMTSIDTTLTIHGLNAEDFKIIKSTDTIFYLKQLYEGIDGKTVGYDENSFTAIKAKVIFDFSFVQYTIDDNPAYPIAYSRQSEWTELNCINGEIEIPDFYGNTQSRRVHEQLNYPNFEEFKKSFNQDFEIIKRESIDEQSDFYKNLIQNKSRYVECCPEYITQAETFLKTNITDFNSIDELGLELFYKSIVIEVTGKLINGKNFKRIIIEK